MLGNKSSSGATSQIWYDPPGGAGSGTPLGNMSLYPVPDSTFASGNLILFTGHKPFQYFNASTDIPDVPPYFYNSLVWGLADQLAYEYGVSFAARSMITKKAEAHKEKALSFGVEEGSFKIQAQPSWDWEGE